MIIDLIHIKQLMKDHKLGSNFLILDNGTCIVSSQQTINEIVNDLNFHFENFKPGSIDFSSSQLDSDYFVVSYNEPNVYNFVNVSNTKNKSNTFISILGRNQLLRDLCLPKIYAVVINDEIVENFPDFKIQRYRES